MRDQENIPDLSEEIIIKAIGKCDSALDVVEKREGDLDAEQKSLEFRRDSLATTKAELEKKREMLVGLLGMQDAERKVELMPGIPDREPIKFGRRHGKPDVQIIAEILEERGKLHVSDIVRLGRERGIPFVGKRRPEQIARNKLNASDRFALVGANVWCLAEQADVYIGKHPIAPTPASKSTNGHHRMELPIR